jgi:hypothetical protein
MVNMEVGEEYPLKRPVIDANPGELAEGARTQVEEEKVITSLN